jgi:hypothetical protein
MVSFLSPLFLLGALAAAVPIVLHLLKREPEARLKFSAVKLLRRAPVEHTRRRHLNELLLLALRVAALALLALAFARPFFVSAASSASSTLTVIALDTSLSLSAPGQFEKARERARAALAGAETDLVALVTFADRTRIAARPTTDRAIVRSSVDAASAGYGATRYQAALNAASDLFEGRSGSLVVVTDMQATGWRPGDEAILPEAVKLELADVGPPPPNFAVVGARAAGDRVIAVVRNTADEARDARVRLTLDGRPGGEAVVAVDADQTSEVALPIGSGREAVVAVDDPAGAPGDNAWYLVIDARATPVVLVVTATGDLERDAFYLRRAIAAAGSAGSAYDVEGVAAARLSSWKPPQLTRFAAVVLASTRGLESRGRDLLAGYLQNGGGVMLAAGPQIDADVASQAVGATVALTMPDTQAAVEERAFAPGDLRHPIFEAFGARSAALSLARFQRIALISASSCQTLARFTTGEAALVDCGHGTGRVVAFASDLNSAWNDFPRHATFVPFIHQVVRYLSAAGPPPGGMLVADLPADRPKPGFLDVAGVPGGRQAVNVDPAESRPDRLDPAAFETAVTRINNRGEAPQTLAARAQEERQRVWQYVLGLMVAMLLVETFVGARTS